MIKSILFDMVGVLFHFDTESYYTSRDILPSDREIIGREVFRSLEWAMQDRGVISEADAVSAICERVPARLHPVVRDFICRQNRDMLPIPGMNELLTDLKKAGYRLFLLSNTSEAFHRFRANVPGIDLFDDTMISADVNLVKPDPMIFRLACERFDIIPQEAAFIDDTPINAEAAQHVGMKAFVFNNDVAELIGQLEKAGIQKGEPRHSGGAPGSALYT